MAVYSLEQRNIFQDINSPFAQILPGLGSNRITPSVKRWSPSADSQIERLKGLQNGLLSDFTVKCHGFEYRTHKVILAIHSGYFYRLFSSDVKDSQCGEINIEEPSIQPAYLEMLLDYMYTGNIEVNKNCMQILAVSEFLVMEDVSAICCSSLLKAVTCDHFVDTWDVMTLYGKKAMEKSLIDNLASQFNKVQWSKEFLQLSYDRLNVLLKNANNSNTDMRSTFRAILRWVRSNIEQRKQYLVMLKDFINLNSLPLPFLISMLEDSTLMKEIPQLSVEIMTTVINNRLWLKKKIFVLCTINAQEESISIECFNAERINVATHIWELDDPSSLSKNMACGLVSQLYFISPTSVYTYSLDTKDTMKLNYTSKLASNPRAQCAVSHIALYIVCDNHAEEFLLPESYDGWQKKPSLLYQPTSPVVLTVDDTLYVVSTDLFIQYFSNRENKWIAVDRRSTFESCEEHILSGFIASSTENKKIYLLKTSNCTLYKIDTFNHDVYSCSLPTDNTLPFIRCMDVFEGEDELHVVIIIEDGLWMEYKGLPAWVQCNAEGSLALRKNPIFDNANKWVPKNSVAETRGYLTNTKKQVDLAVTTYMHLE